MVKFSSLLQFRKYVDKLPLRDIVIDLFEFEIFEDGFDGGVPEFSELVGNLMFKLDDDDLNCSSGWCVHDGDANHTTLFCYYFHDINDIWVVPFNVSAIFKVQLNARNNGRFAHYPLFYTPPVPIVSFSYPVHIYMSLEQGHAAWDLPFFRTVTTNTEKKATRILFDINGKVTNFEVLIKDKRFTNGHRVINASDEEVNGREGSWFNRAKWPHERFYNTFGINYEIKFNSNKGRFKWKNPYLILVPINAMTLNYPRGDFSVI